MHQESAHCGLGCKVKRGKKSSRELYARKGDVFPKTRRYFKAFWTKKPKKKKKTDEKKREGRAR